MKTSESVLLVCPYCKKNFAANLEYNRGNYLSSILIKGHVNGDQCPPFIAFIDANGRHRGSQKIDNYEEDKPINEQLVENASRTINELEETIRFYHLKAPRRNDRGFEHKVANVKDRAFMSTPFYSSIINFLAETRNDNVFGIINCEISSHFEGGALIYGKYLGMIYTLFWKNQRELKAKNFDDLQGYANLTVEKLLDVYDIVDFFF